ncbi:MAG: HPr family phosphocarrier protein [Mycoplasma sp.]
MVKSVIKLEIINDVKEFVNIVNKYDFDIDLASGRYVVNVKSIMGIFSLDLTKKIEIKVDADKKNSWFFEKIKKYLV